MHLNISGVIREMVQLAERFIKEFVSVCITFRPFEESQASASPVFFPIVFASFPLVVNLPLSVITRLARHTTHTNSTKPVFKNHREHYERYGTHSTPIRPPPPAFPAASTA
jgi:hypothetical protein